MDNAGERRTWRKYYLNVCRPLNPVPGCDRYAAACQMRYTSSQVRPPSRPSPTPIPYPAQRGPRRADAVT